MRDYLREAGETAFTSPQDRSVATAVQQATQTADDLGKGLQRSVRIGDFPESLAYLTQRLQATRRLAIVTIPFLQFGVLANPRGQKEFRDTLHEVFNGAGLNADRTLIIVTQSKDDARIDVARHRYDDAPGRAAYPVRPRGVARIPQADARRRRISRRPPDDQGGKIRCSGRSARPSRISTATSAWTTRNALTNSPTSKLNREWMTRLFRLCRQPCSPMTPKRKKTGNSAITILFGRLVRMRVALAEAMAWQGG